MKISSKKAITTLMLIIIIISLISLLLISFQVKTMIGESSYQTSLLACSTFFNSVEGESSYFGNSFDKPTDKLINTIASICSSREIEISSTTLNKAAELVHNCWDKTAKGQDIFGTSVRGEGICLYCGSFKAEKDIISFKEDFKLEIESSISLFEETQIVNLNEAFLKDFIPKTVLENELVTVFYYVYKPKYPENNDITPFVWAQETWGKKLYTFLGDSSTGLLSSEYSLVRLLGRGTILTNSLISPSAIETHGGILLTKSFKREGKTINSLDSLAQTCTVIIPEKHYS